MLLFRSTQFATHNKISLEWTLLSGLLSIVNCVWDQLWTILTQISNKNLYEWTKLKTCNTTCILLQTNYVKYRIFTLFIYFKLLSKTKIYMYKQQLLVITIPCAGIHTVPLSLCFEHWNSRKVIFGSWQPYTQDKRLTCVLTLWCFLNCEYKRKLYCLANISVGDCTCKFLFSRVIWSK